MIKRIMAITLSIVLIFGCVSFAEETSVNPYEKEIGFLNSIGLLPEGFSADSPMMRGTFAKMITDLLYFEMDVTEIHETSFTDLQYGSDFYNAVSILEGLNIVKGNGKNTFAPDAQIAYQDALVILIKAMGYYPYAEANGGYPTGYLYTAKQIGLANGISDKGPMDMKTGAKLIYNTLFVSSVILDNVSKNGIELGIDYTSNFLEKQLGITRYKARLVNDGLVSFDNTEITDNVIIIENLENNQYISVDNGGIDVSEFLGCYVDAFIKNDKETGKTYLIHMSYDSKVETTTVNAGDIVNVDSGLGYVEYETNPESGKLDKAYISTKNPVFIKNGIRLIQAKEADLKPAFGNIKFIDNDGDKKADVVLITDILSNIVVNSVAEDGSSVVCKDNPINTLDLSDSSKTAYRVYKNGKVVSLKDISPDNIVSIAPAGYLKNGVQIYFLYVSDKTIEGILTSVDSASKTIFIDDVEYEFSGSYYGTHSNIYKILTNGTSYTVRLDYFGQVGFIDGISSDNIDYAYLLNVYKENEHDGIKISLYSEYAAINTLDISKNLVIDGINVGNSDISRIVELLCTRNDGNVIIPKAHEKADYMQSATAINPRLAIVKVNAKGEIYYIDTDARTHDDDKLEHSDPYVLTSGQRYLRDTRLKTAKNIEYGTPDGSFLTSDDTIVIQVPDIDRYKLSGSREDINLFELPLSDLNSYRIIRASDMNSYEFHDMQPYNIDPDSGIADILLLRGYHNYSSEKQENSVFQDYCIFKKLTKINTGKDDESDFYKLYYMNQLGEDLSVLVDKNDIHTHFKNIIFGGNYFDASSNPVPVEPLEPGDVFYFTHVNGELSMVGRMLNLTDINSTCVSGIRTYTRNYLYQNKYGTSVSRGIPYDVEGSTSFGGVSSTFSVEFGLPLRISGTIVKMYQPYKTGTTQPGTLKADVYNNPGEITGRTVFEPFDLAESKILVVEEKLCKDDGDSKCEVSIRPGTLEDIKFVDSFATDGYKKCSKLFFFRNAGYAHNLVIYNLNENHDIN